MMRSLLLALALAATLFTASAQTHYEGNIAVGAKGGVTLSRLKFSPSVPQTMLPGFMAGVTFRYIEEKHFGVIAELNLEQRGWKEKFIPIIAILAFFMVKQFVSYCHRTCNQDKHQQN